MKLDLSAGDFCEDAIGFGCPDERFRVAVIPLEVLFDYISRCFVYLK